MVRAVDLHCMFGAQESLFQSQICFPRQFAHKILKPIVPIISWRRPVQMLEQVEIFLFRLLKRVISLICVCVCASGYIELQSSRASCLAGDFD